MGCPPCPRGTPGHLGACVGHFWAGLGPSGWPNELELPVSALSLNGREPPSKAVSPAVGGGVGSPKGRRPSAGHGPNGTEPPLSRAPRGPKPMALGLRGPDAESDCHHHGSSFQRIPGKDREDRAKSKTLDRTMTVDTDAADSPIQGCPGFDGRGN